MTSGHGDRDLGPPDDDYGGDVGKPLTYNDDDDTDVFIKGNRTKYSTVEG